MNYELITIVFTIVGTGIAMTGLIVPRLSKIDNHIADLRERMARLEGSIDVLKDLFQVSVTGRTQ
ncbi:MAG: hypothetical protein OXS28_05630 [Gammaproteobacteria bacterium]|nr:hypothetical protein [Gammaproteobacteria bacterium]MDE0284320.1 hypothetical protein [Gammaproteobacteria bacterium]